MPRVMIAVSIVAVLLSCGGRHSTPYYPLLFEQPIERDTADFVHLLFDEYPISIEILGKLFNSSDSLYGVQFQVGIYGSPGYDDTLLELDTGLFRITANGVAPKSIHNFPISYHQPPWVRSTGVWVAFEIGPLVSALEGDLALEYNVDISECVRYGGRRLPIEPLTVYDPWFRKIVVDTMVTETP